MQYSLAFGYFVQRTGGFANLMLVTVCNLIPVVGPIVTLGYLGLGVEPPTPDWGQMIADGQSFLTTNWQLSTVPGIAVVITGLGLSLLGDGLADLLRPE